MASQEQNHSTISSSKEIRSLMAIVAFLMVSGGAGWYIAGPESQFRQALLRQAHRVGLESSHFITSSIGSLLNNIHALLPFFSFLALIAILANVLRTAPVITPLSLTPDPVRIKPVPDLKRPFMWRVSAAVIKSLIKLLLLGSTLYFATKFLLSGLAQIRQFSPIPDEPPVSLEGVIRIFTLGCALAFIAILDFIYRRLPLAGTLERVVHGLKKMTKRRGGDLYPRAPTPEMQAEALGRQGAAS